MHPFKLIPLAAALAFTLSACSGNDPETTIDAGRGEPVAMVNDTPIYESDLADFLSLSRMSGHQGGMQPPEMALNELINMELLRQTAVKAGLDKEPEVMRQMERMRTNLLINAQVERYLQNLRFTEADLRAEYDRQVAEMDTQEFRARHILVATEEEAAALIARIKAGEDFATLAREHSEDGSAAAGGDLGWFSRDMMVPDFSDAVLALGDGQFTQEPVETEFGWHVILREGARESEPPAFEGVQDQLEQILTRQSLQDYVDGLWQDAQVEVFEDRLMR
ncbi:peptidylprolyl isomerase [Ectothiorhodospira lacustris]|uniref:peptidylprolyl isomerase n=1 Tax=Ectothiorhodospira lacustris TaxID=2899127 RepID=UPI001EE8E957|nr:peptidylprolyl isomerase [Ectothiorhodospira lacustris]MCG5500392.1 peptidylprolyl isomerase [Ectothiorhodospira lacustris]MCG5510447.1 peptidylprolyl isomerase [Ectothiorhodospira lacustris]MCG5522193.1 peptidylprolyl isomerase [Ectothiorhodospira lacustris]